MESSDTPADFKGQRLNSPDFSGSHIHDANFEGARITDAWLKDADVSGYVKGMTLNGIEVWPLVEAELNRRTPERAKLTARDPSGLAEGWTVIEEIWAKTLESARGLPDAMLYERVDGEWSFVETLRHLILATDTWLGRMVKGEARPWHPWGLAGPWLKDPEAIGLDSAARPSLDEVLTVRGGRMDSVRQTIARTSQEDLLRMCVPPDTTHHPNQPRTVLQCLHVILDEEWEHNRYANRDLAALQAGVA
jgi:uncharacterized protein YjbI with pentapeptide repeats